MSDFENGGAIAIKGFNFQKAAITYIAIKNYDKPNFFILVEAKDDFEVKLDNYEAYIQVKSQKLSLKKILNEKEGKSVLEKNLTNGDENSQYKIFVKGFAQTDIKKMTVIDNGTICGPLYGYNTDQKNEIINQFKNNSSLTKVEEKLLSSYIYELPFIDKLENAITVLLGEMTYKEIDVGNKRGQIAINELFTLIDQKSEYIVKSEDDYMKKGISQTDLEGIFKLTSTIEMFNEILDATSYTFFKKNKIKKEQLKIIHAYTEEKKIAVGNIRKINILDYEVDELIDIACEQCDYDESFNILDIYIKIAIIIEVLTEMGEEM